MLETLYAAVLDGDVQGADKRVSRDAAERDAAWLRKHPDVRDRKRFGHGGRVKVCRVYELDFIGSGLWEEYDGNL